ncbi:MAG: polyphosphate kinase 1 [Ruthenibacterium sp.]
MENQTEQDIFINRELSWLAFNRRVLDLAKEKAVPIGEQLKFAAIYASNLDEFFMVRVGSLYDRTLLKQTEAENKTGMTPYEQLQAIMPKVAELQAHCDKIVLKLTENLQKLGYQKVNFDKLNKEESRFWKKYFLGEFFPVLSPQVIDRRHPFPFLRNNEVYVGTMIKAKNDVQTSFGLIPISAQYGRIIFTQTETGVTYALVEELVMHFADLVFGKKAVQSRCIFRVTRNADITVDEAMFDHDLDYRTVMSELLKKRRKLAAVRLQTSAKAPQEIVSLLCEKLMIPANQVFEQLSPLDMSIGFKLAAKMASAHKSAWFYPARRPILPSADFSLTQVVKQQDVLIQYPYQSIRPFIRMLLEAALNPDVISIKMTLYRVAQESKIIEALMTAAENGKEVVTIVELRARFDEQNNIDFSKQLEEAGCTVIYGFNDYKVHSKLCLITKKNGNQLEYITQIGTGNYNEKTSEQYTDLSFVTSDVRIGAELANVFNNLAMERLTESTARLLVAPLCFKSVLMQEMDAEIAAKKMGKDASILLKCNSISDKDIIEKISEASCAGVPVKMIVRGICCIKAGVPGLTENVTVRSIVGRYLEHSRIYTFGTGDHVRVYIASGDFLTRNTQRRVEAGVRIEDKKIVAELVQTLALQWADTVNAREMQPDGNYTKVKGKDGEEPIDSQLLLYQSLATVWPETLHVDAPQAEVVSKTEILMPKPQVPQPKTSAVQPSKVVPRTAAAQRRSTSSPQKRIVRPHKKTLFDTLVNLWKK